MYKLHFYRKLNRELFPSRFWHTYKKTLIFLTNALALLNGVYFRSCTSDVLLAASCILSATYCDSFGRRQGTIQKHWGHAGCLMLGVTLYPLWGSFPNIVAPLQNNDKTSCLRSQSVLKVPVGPDMSETTPK